MKILKSFQAWVILSMILILQQDLINAQSAAEKFDPSAQRVVSIEPLLVEQSTMERLLSDVESRKLHGDDWAEMADLFPEFIIHDAYITVDLIASGATSDLVTELSNFNYIHHASFRNAVSGRIHFDDLSALASLSNARSYQVTYRPTRMTGGVASQGDTTLFGHNARAVYNLDGTGVKIGILSDSYNTLGGEASAITSGDLPGAGNPNGYTTPVTVLAEYGSTGTDEARAMAEVVHDIIPAAEIYVHTAFGGIADFAQGILDLEAAGCDIIVDDVSYLAEPMFQDGLISQAIDQVTANGVHYFTSAGNRGDKSYESAFVNSGYYLYGQQLHDFDPGSGVDYTQSITIPDGVTVSIALQWDDPYGNLPGAIGGADTNLGLYLSDASTGSWLTWNNVDNIGGDPYELISYTNSSGSDLTANLWIERWSGPNPTFMKYVIYQNSVSIDEYVTNSGTTIGHANAEGAFSIGASAFYNTSAYGASPAAINGFSSRGGSPILFDDVGNAITPEYRNKPDFVGPDGTNTTFFGTDIAQDADAHPNFFGTSASAPHIAGVVGLVVDFANTTTRAELFDALQNTAEDMDDPNTAGFDTGYDEATGYGFININAAIAYLVALPVELISFEATPYGPDAALLKWETATEIDNDGFILQHQNTWGEFITIARINGSNDPYGSQYMHTVDDLKSGTHYFRLLQEDLDGTTTDLGIQSVWLEGSVGKSWFYQPSESLGSISFQADLNTNYQLEITDVNGQLVFRKAALYDANRIERIHLPVGDWSKGMYFYRISFNPDSNTQFASGKMVIQ